MCWRTYKIAEKKTAKEDIPVFKIMYPSCKSIYYLKGYELDVLYTSELDSPIQTYDYYGRGNFIVNRGFHSYLKESVKTLRNEPQDLNGTFTSLNHYFHTLVIVSEKNHMLDNLSLLNNSYIKVSGIIPKGSKYYLNEDGEIVSDQIILKYSELI